LPHINIFIISGVKKTKKSRGRAAALIELTIA